MGRSTFQLVLLAFVFLQSYAKAEPSEIIKNAEYAKPKQLPYQVYLVNEINATHRTHCSGVIVSELAVLTPAHCVENSISVDIYFGANFINNINERGQQKMTINSNNIILYQYRHKIETGFEMALIRLAIKLIFDEFIQPVLLPFANQDFSNHTVIVSDWIDSEEHEVDSREIGAKQLMFIEGQVLSPEICKHQLETKSHTENINCIGSSASDFRFGESAITVARNTDGSFTLFSISSFAIFKRFGISDIIAGIAAFVGAINLAVDTVKWIKTWW